ncbi:DUF3953 domain-containing protein [Virgibacillus sp. MSP4-1]|uniref:DUF3953 domain-containing protein n=1 Tax=Virgibacillus sp. MSP4-1 TaxID=2700081 RepID=UPI0003A57416|nr:DUF3953 domain-containing protein [Virgibacillus sp. MSP4-1]QHS22062.1 DUF3953 domain-containing protein [Virgibacillus sp. MSP4-1]
MSIVKMILALSVLSISTFGFLNKSIDLSSIMLFLLGALLLTMGAEEIKKEKKFLGYLLIIIAFFNIFVAFQDYFLS